MFKELFKMVNQLVDLNETEKLIFQNAFTFRKISKNQTLIAEGQIATEIYFINKGLLRLYYNNDGDLITAYIFREHLFAGSYASFLESSPSIQSLDALEDCELLVLSKEKLDQLYKDIPKVNILTRKIAEQ
jgi:CRP-like cAMP-binding protein